jgi:nuclear cap-binding protein subunit 1
MVELVLASLPWAARDLSERNPHDFNRMFESIEKYINARKSLQDPRLQVLTVHQKGYSGIPSDKLELLWTQMLKLKEQNWDAQILPKPYTLFESTLGSALQHDVPEFTPVPHDSSVTYPTPTNVFFCYSEHLTKCQSPAYYIISDVISDLIDLMEHNRRECIKYILSIPSSFPDDTFYTAKEVDPEQEAGEIDNPISLLSLEKIIIESIFNKVLTLPNPCHKPVYYGVLIVEGIKSSPVAFTYALKSAIPGMYEQISDIDIGCINRLYNWFSHYLSHIEYKWDFDSFGQVWDLEFVDFRRVFVAGTLEKCIRLAYYERIKEAISEPMQALIGDLSPEPSYKYKNVDENTPQGKLKKQIDSFVQSKADINMIKHCVNEANANPELTTDIIREIVIETLLVQGSKSFSHMLNVIERYSGVFTFLIDNDSAKDHLVQLVVSFWSPVPQWMGIQLDKFTNYNLISSSNIINWLFSENAMQHYHRAHVWEILQNTINKLRYWILDIETQIKRLSPDDNMQTDDFDPYADEISSLQTNLTSARQELKNNIFLVFQGFCSILSKYLTHLDSQGRNHNEDTLFRIMAGRFREFGRDYLEIYSPFMVTLENITFTKDVDPRVFSLFAELQSLANPPKFDQAFNFN